MSHTHQISKDRLKLNLKSVGYVLFLVPVALPLTAYGLWMLASAHPSLPAVLTAADVYAFLPLIVLYLVVPVIDLVIGKDPYNPLEEDVAELSRRGYYRMLVCLNLPLAVFSLATGMALFIYWAELGVAGKIGLILSFGMVHAGIMINAAHELVHKSTRFEQRIGGILLSMVLYPSFKIEHVRGHHVNVATPKDASTSRLGQSLYDFIGRAMFNNVRAAWRLEADLLRKRNKPVLSWHNELIRWYTLTVLIAVACTLTFGWAGLLFFLGQGIVAIMLLETVNYLEHYGLRRRLLDNGRYERTTHEHSWNSNYLLSNLLTFQLQRHSDHHANPQRRYQVLRHFDDSPQLPAGYPLMILLAMVPPLWMRVMNPRVRAYYRDEDTSA